ncbi:MAG TPA: universal stress protein [Methylomirabilota bacterium]|jgi:nucleotide-binding universal stress UspA family protein|nr:universal stress protein [Methylomirabilota bacterium]
MRVLVATDGSRDADEAVEWLVHFPLPADATIDVASAIPRPIFDERVLPTPWSELEEQTRRVVEDARARLAKRWPAATGQILHGDARSAIVDAATSGAADLIVMGARGLGAITSLLLGSVSLGVARHAPCSVLVCRSAARPVTTVTVGLDGGTDAGAALTFFRDLPLSSGIVARLVGVVEPLRYPSSAPSFMSAALAAGLSEYENDRRRELDAVLADAAETLRWRVGRVVSVTPTGAPADVLLADAEAHHSDLIVVGARGVGGFKRLVLGSVSESVLRHAGCPVLIARPRG